MCDFENKQQYTEENEINKPVATVHYRGYDVNVYDDDYGQCYYFYFEGQQYGCGTYNLDYEGEVKSVIDHHLDFIETIQNEKPHYPSASIKYAYNQETGERKKAIYYDGYITELETQEGDYHSEAKRIMDKIDAEYDAMHKGSKPRTYFKDLMAAYEKELEDSEKDSEDID